MNIFLLSCKNKLNFLEDQIFSQGDEKSINMFLLSDGQTTISDLNKTSDVNIELLVNVIEQGLNIEITKNIFSSIEDTNFMISTKNIVFGSLKGSRFLGNMALNFIPGNLNKVVEKLSHSYMHDELESYKDASIFVLGLKNIFNNKFSFYICSIPKIKGNDFQFNMNYYSGSKVVSLSLLKNNNNLFFKPVIQVNSFIGVISEYVENINFMKPNEIMFIKYMRHLTLVLFSHNLRDYFKLFKKLNIIFTINSNIITIKIIISKISFTFVLENNNVSYILSFEHSLDIKETLSKPNFSQSF